MYALEQLVKTLKLEPHPEGGYFRESYRSSGYISSDNLPNDIDGNRNYCTGIYYLLKSDDFSAFHRINQDEMWHFYMGNAIQITMISTIGELESITLGQDLSRGQLLQFVVPKNYWFAAKVVASNSYALVGCTVSPGFDFKDFELAQRHRLIAQFPQHKAVIKSLTRS